MKTYYVYPENQYDKGVWCYSIISKFWFEFWVGIKTWFVLNPQRVCTIELKGEHRD